MKKKMLKVVCLPCLCALFLLGSTLNVAAFEISIQFSPNVLNVQSQAQVVTIHTDISYGSVDAHTVYLNGVAINSWKSDNRGNFVAKFIMEEIEDLEGLVYGDYNEFMLVGTTYGDDEFWGVDEILVVNIVPKGGR